jgi:hypothetical protein
LHFVRISLRLVFPPPFQVTKAMLSAGPKFEVFALVRNEERAAKALGSEANQVSAMFFCNLIFWADVDSSFQELRVILVSCELCSDWEVFAVLKQHSLS